MRLQNKVAFITDADADSGKALIKQFSNEGAHFILNSPSDGEAIKENLAYCKNKNLEALVVNIDLCNTEKVNIMLQSAAQRIGTVDIFIHNNNVVIPASVETCDEDIFLHVMDSNTKSAFICTQVVGKQMVEKQSGTVIYISSIHAEKPTGSSFLYSISKGAIKLLNREAALILGRHGVNVNTIELGPVEGDHERFKSDISDLYDSYQYKVPNAVLGDHEDLANLALFLSTNEAHYINGADIRLDGGFILHYMDHQMKKANIPYHRNDL